MSKFQYNYTIDKDGNALGHEYRDAFKVTCECLLEINRPELLCYIFAGPEGEYYDGVISHFEMNDNEKSGFWQHRSLAHHTVGKRFPVKSKTTMAEHHFHGATNVVRHSMEVMMQSRNLQPLPIEDVALIEKAMRIGMSAFDIAYACGVCEITFEEYGVRHALTVDIMKVAK